MNPFRSSLRALAAAPVLCLALCASARAQAALVGDESRRGQDAIRAVDNSVSAAYAPLHVFYAEPSDGGIAAANFDTEDGTLSDGVTLAAAAMRSVGSWRDLFAQATFSRAVGRLPYDGHIQLAVPPLTLPFQGYSSARINDWGLRLGKGVEAGERWLWTPYLAYGYHTWARTLPSKGTVTGYSENYSHHALQIGNRVQFASSSRLVLTADGRFGSIVDPQIQSPDVSPTGAFDERLGASPIIDLEAEADYALRGPLHVFAGWRYSRYGYGQSGVNTNLELIEPVSTTELMSFLIGLRFSFK